MIDGVLSLATVSSLVALLSLQPAWKAKEGNEWLGRSAPEWSGLQWLQGGPLDLQRLRGQPVFVRFWTNGCPFCEESGPTLRGLWDGYRDRGLLVVGIHHPKSTRNLDDIRKAIKALGFTFPIATDLDWKTVRAYGVGTSFKAFTSISVLIDQCGVIRFVHDGGAIRSGEPAHRALIETIDRLLARPPSC
jgi:peroxiredoxin